VPTCPIFTGPVTITVAYNCTVCIIYNDDSIMLRYDIANLYAWMCIVERLEFVVIVIRQGPSYNLIVHIILQII